ncbi:MAG: hypothetical protein AABW68_04005 [archaeon]
MNARSPQKKKVGTASSLRKRIERDAMRDMYPSRPRKPIRKG